MEHPERVDTKQGAERGMHQREDANRDAGDAGPVLVLHQAPAHAYASGGDVYFRVRSDPAYGSLSHRQLENMDQGEEVEGAERKDDPLELQQVKVAARTPLSPSGTLYYFSRVLPITEQDKQVTFVTKVGPLEVKCKFTLHDMLYHGNLEL